jgi:hypothetical protein
MATMTQLNTVVFRVYFRYENPIIAATGLPTGKVTICFVTSVKRSPGLKVAFYHL